MSLTKVRNQMIEGAAANVLDFGAVGDGVTDDTAAIQAAATYVSSIGGELIFPAGTYIVTTRIDFTGNGVKVVLSQNATISHDTPDYIAFKFTGDYSSITGGHGGGFVGPEVWDGANVAPTYAVILIEGNYGYVNTRLFNIRKYGIWFKDCEDGTVEGSIIEGNYPTGQWTGTEVGHVGILFDTGVANTGNFKLIDSTVKTCVQGCQPANYGAGGLVQSMLVAGCTFESCWNHGVYSNFTNGLTITGNSFNRCQLPVVVSGDNNVVSSNTMYTATTAAGDERDVVGISVRDGSSNIITNNTIKGVLVPANTVCIDVSDVSGLYPMNNNIISNNTIWITAGSGIGIRVQGVTQSITRNIISGNTIITQGTGNAAQGVITIYGQPSSINYSNKVINNQITMLGTGEGFYCTYQTAGEFSGNTVEVAYNAGAAANVYAAWIAFCDNFHVNNNTLYCATGAGANITFYAYRESSNTAGGTLSRVNNNVGGSATFALGVIENGGGLLADLTGTGAPSFPALIGSMWRRTDGGAGTTLYIKESGTDNTGWVGK